MRINLKWKGYKTFLVIITFLIGLTITENVSAKESNKIQKEEDSIIEQNLGYGCDMENMLGPIDLDPKESGCPKPKPEPPAETEDEEVQSKDLTITETLYLKNNVGLTEDMIKEIPIDELRYLIEEEAVLSSSSSQTLIAEDEGNSTSNTSIETSDTGVITDNIMKPNQGGDLNKKKIKLNSYVYKLGTVTKGKWKGYKRFKLYGTWKWLSAPINTYTDAFAVGFGDPNLVIPTAKGDADEFSADYYRWDSRMKKWYLTQYSFNTNNFEPNGGVGWKFNIRRGAAQHKGQLTQYVYTRATHGDANIKFTYGHAHTIFTPSFSKGTSWYSVLPSITVKVGYAANTLRW
ncbi:hypothetical protein J6TS2_11810 [Heyndrickxia sporothermodurans]|nr:hypothetical protein J6TS2_11810 [Heyndrickxia sporothermodurans]